MTAKEKHKGDGAQAPTSSDIKARIASERERLAGEEAHELQLMQDRLEPLEAGDDGALDAVEQRISDSRAAQLRIQERVQLLLRRLTDAEQREESSRIDAVAARAEHARQVGEKLLRTTYAQQAKALAATLLQLLAIDQFIRQQNRVLDNARRDAVPSPNQIRHVPARVETVRVRKMVGIAEALHPDHQRYLESIDHKGKVHAGPKTSLQKPVEIEVEERIRHPGSRPDPVYIAIPEIPAATAGDERLFWLRQAEADDAEGKLAAAIAELGLTP